MSPVATHGKLRVALFQSLGFPGDIDRTLERLEEVAGDAAAAGAGLLVTPELFLGGYVDNVRELAKDVAAATDSAAERVSQIAKNKGIAVAYGYPELDETGKKRSDGDPVVYNSVRLFDSNAVSRANYRKTHLVGAFEHNHFTPGTETVVQTELNGLKIGFLICYDVEFPENVRAHTVKNTDLLVVPTAVMDPFLFVPDFLVPTRAFENNVYIAYANRIGTESPREGTFEYVGRSTLVAPDGTALARAGRGGRSKERSMPGGNELVFGEFEELIFGDVDRDFLAASRSGNPYRKDRRPDLYTSLHETDPEASRV
jgi:predicted amidohydrolase